MHPNSRRVVVGRFDRAANKEGVPVGDGEIVGLKRLLLNPDVDDLGPAGGRVVVGGRRLSRPAGFVRSRTEQAVAGLQVGRVNPVAIGDRAAIRVPLR